MGTKFRVACKLQVLKFLKKRFNERYSVTQINSKLRERFARATVLKACKALTEEGRIEKTRTNGKDKYHALRPLHLTIGFDLGGGTGIFLEDVAPWARSWTGRDFLIFLDVTPNVVRTIALHWDKRCEEAKS